MEEVRAYQSSVKEKIDALVHDRAGRCVLDRPRVLHVDPSHPWKLL